MNIQNFKMSLPFHSNSMFGSMIILEIMHFKVNEFVFKLQNDRTKFQAKLDQMQ